MGCLCFSMDEEKQMIACVLLNYQCGLCPTKCCNYDKDGMCFGCVCCMVQFDYCWGGCLF
ncbi:hypothetical protein B484DRAFT_445709 [Ochromonadaceae sp. CCMP2298]|nr:hypothetical protein B484DRAFT_458430 [Ochromonadaceae sp. CCMP2298]KAJ1436179.1 hypothetical protein B484DRAFT_445709 [Ochromonadaceae sp. CCMP2298]